MGPVIVTLGEEEAAQSAAGGCSTETSYLCIVLSMGWREDGSFWGRAGNAEANCLYNTEVSLVSVIQGLQQYIRLL